ncbi:hypothetical protein ACI2K3_12410 [Staphylococcus cohnii]|uniref:hypothetical protein n=1 Tax=Staphylococcus cohnii TaxID=29382 RepID=UPI00384BB193
MGPVEFVTTKNASELLKISASSLRVYAQHMESVGYSFKKIDNARQFSKHDLQIISEAMERYKLIGGSMKDALHYVIVKEEYGEEEAENLTPAVSTQSHNSEPLDISQFKNELAQDVSTNINKTLNNHFEKVIEAISESNNNDKDIKPLEDEINRIRALNEQIKSERDHYKNKNAELVSELEEIKNMGIFEFRKWKKK